MTTRGFRRVVLAGLLSLFPARAFAVPWTQTEFQIGGYTFTWNPDTTLLRRIDAAGIDWIWCWDGGGATHAKAATINARLDALHRRPGFRLRCLPVVVDPNTSPGRFSLNKDRAPSLRAIDATLAPGRGINSGSTMGWGVWDEPCEASDFANIGLIARHIDSTQSGRLPYVNLFAMYIYENAQHAFRRGERSCYWTRFGGPGGAGLSKEAGYEAYVDAYLSQFDRGPRPAPILSFDHYRFQVLETFLWNDYFWNLRILRDKAAEYTRPHYRIPLWLVTQLSPFRTTTARPFPATFSLTNTRWQIYGALAYGAKGISYWLLTPAYSKGEGDWGPGIFRSNTASDTVPGRYSQVRALNRELHRLGPTLMRLDAVAVFHRDTLDQAGIADERFASEARVYDIVAGFGPGSDSAMVGYLKDRTNGDDYLMVVSKALRARQSFELTLGRAADSLFRIDRGTGRAVRLGTRTTRIRLDRLAPGQGELFRIVDRTTEYIPRVRVTAVAGDTTWYGHDRGVVMVVRSTGRRTYHRAAAPVVDLAVADTHVYAALASRSIVRMNRDLSNPGPFQGALPATRAGTTYAAGGAR